MPSITPLSGINSLTGAAGLRRPARLSPRGRPPPPKRGCDTPGVGTRRFDQKSKVANNVLLIRAGIARTTRPRIGRPILSRTDAAVFDSVTINALSSAMDGLALRQQTIAQNIANVNTPNYKAKIVSFENALASSVAQGSGVATPTVTTSTAASQQNGNNVSVDSETLNNIETVLRYQFASQAVNMDFDATKSALQTS